MSLITAVLINKRLGDLEQRLDAPVGFAHARTVLIDNTNGAAKADYPVKVTLASGAFDFGKARPAGEDVRFRDDAGAWLPYWIEAWSATEATVWVKVPSIPANATTSITLLYGNDSVPAASDGHATFLAFAGDFTPAAIEGRVGDSGLLVNRLPDPVAQAGGSGWRQDLLREPSNILYDPDDAGHEYKLYITGGNGMARSVGLYTASSPHGQWTEHPSNPVVPDAEDPYVLKVGGTYHLYCESYRDTHAGTVIDHYTSSDGRTWALDGVVIPKGPDGSWDAALTGSPLVVHDGTTFHMLYEGIDEIPGAGNEQTGYASSTDGSTFTKGASNPLGALRVIDDYAVIDGVGVFTAHDGGGVSRVFTGPADPSAWATATFTEVPDHSPSWISSGGSVMLVEGDGGVLALTTSPDHLAAHLWRFAGGASFTPRVHPPDTYRHRFSVGGGRLHLASLAAQDSHEALLGTFTVTNDISIAVCKRFLGGGGANSNRRYTSLWVGAGELNTTGAHMPRLTNGIGFLNDAAPGASGSAKIRRDTAGVITDLANGVVSPAEATGFHVHEGVILADGTLQFLLDGDVRATATDATHVMSEKRVIFSHGSSLSTRAETEVLWLRVRPYDGADPVVVVGPEH